MSKKIKKMSLTEAREIVKEIMQWQMVCMGVFERKEITPQLNLKQYSLADLIRANQMVVSDNLRSDKLAEWHREQGHKVQPRTVYMTLADRLIAAVYTALHFESDGEMIALAHDRGVGVVKAEY